MLGAAWASAVATDSKERQRTAAELHVRAERGELVASRSVCHYGRIGFCASTAFVGWLAPGWGICEPCALIVVVILLPVVNYLVFRLRVFADFVNVDDSCGRACT